MCRNKAVGPKKGCALEARWVEKEKPIAVFFKPVYPYGSGCLRCGHFNVTDLFFNPVYPYGSGCLRCGLLQPNWFFCRYFPVTDLLQAIRPFKSPW